MDSYCRARVSVCILQPFTDCEKRPNSEGHCQKCPLEYVSVKWNPPNRIRKTDQDDLEGSQIIFEEEHCLFFSNLLVLLRQSHDLLH